MWVRDNQGRDKELAHWYSDYPPTKALFGTTTLFTVDYRGEPYCVWDNTIYSVAPFEFPPIQYMAGTKDDTFLLDVNGDGLFALKLHSSEPVIAISSLDGSSVTMTTRSGQIIILPPPK